MYVCVCVQVCVQVCVCVSSEYLGFQKVSSEYLGFHASGRYLVGDKRSKRTKVAKVEGWSPMDLPVEWYFLEYQFDTKKVFQENALGMLLMKKFEIFCLPFDQFDATAGRIPVNI